MAGNMAPGRQEVWCWICSWELYVLVEGERDSGQSGDTSNKTTPPSPSLTVHQLGSNPECMSVWGQTHWNHHIMTYFFHVIFSENQILKFYLM